MSPFKLKVFFFLYLSHSLKILISVSKNGLPPFLWGQLSFNIASINLGFVNIRKSFKSMCLDRIINGLILRTFIGAILGPLSKFGRILNQRINGRTINYKSPYFPISLGPALMSLRLCWQWPPISILSVWVWISRWCLVAGQSGEKGI